MKMKLIKKDRLDETQWQNINYVWLKVVANVETGLTFWWWGALFCRGNRRGQIRVINSYYTSNDNKDLYLMVWFYSKWTSIPFDLPINHH